MTARSPSANPAARHPYGPRPLSALIPVVSRATWRRQGTATAAILADWEAIVGPALAAVSLPRRLSAGTLTLACTGPIATELQHVSAQLIERINTTLGGKPVQRLRFVQDLRRRPAPPPPPAQAEAPTPDLPELPPGPVRDALEALGRAMRASTPAAPDAKL